METLSATIESRPEAPARRMLPVRLDVYASSVPARDARPLKGCR
jgi:hypothetical protein